MMKVVFLGGCLLMSAAAAAQAPDGAQPDPAGAGDADRVICRNVASTESRLSRTRVCMTRAQWEQTRRNGRGSADRPPANQDSPSD